ncbi:hypothetical protein K9N50_00455 [bacterium]|nr:hypothetical protein [bacterium]
MKYCDNTCEYARWPDKLADGAKSCMTFTALYCEKLKRLVYKNNPCEWDGEEATDDNLSEKTDN